MSNAGFGRYKRIVQLFWDPEPKNEKSSPVWCLGKEYVGPVDYPETKVEADHSEPQQESQHNFEIVTPASSVSSKFDEDLAYEESKLSGDEDRGWPSSFLADFESRIWFTYRSHFPPIPRSADPKASAAMSLSVRLRSQLGESDGFTSDTGWGCMIRSGQSLLANAMFILKLGRAWQRGQEEGTEKRLLSLFADDPRAPFSIHRFVEHGAAACGKHPGEWFGPSATAQCIQALSEKNYDSCGLRVYVTRDGSDVYEDTFNQIAKASAGNFTPTLILIGVRLGIERVTPAYWSALKSALQMPQSIGIAGGRPSSSHYFIGVQDSSLFYLDPHQTRPAIPLPSDPLEYASEDISSYHTRRLRMLDLEEMDPSMLLAFLIKDEQDWEDWKSNICDSPDKSIIHVRDLEPSMHRPNGERQEAVDEVESFDDDDDQETVVS